MTTPDTFTVMARSDGTPVAPTLPLIRGDDLGVLRGDGVFEATLVVDGIPRDLPEHLQRLQQSARRLDLAVPTPDEWQPAVATVLAAWGGGDEMVLRFVVTRGPEVAAQAGDPDPSCYAIGSALPDRTRAGRAGISVLTAPRGFSAADIADKPYLLPGAKSLSYAVNMAAGRWARSRGADDVIFIDTDGAVLEGPTSSAVIVRDGSILTPPCDGILDGITVRRLLHAAGDEGWRADVAPLAVDDLRSADGVFLTSSTRVLAPVTSIDGKECGYDDALAKQLSLLLAMPGR